MTTWTTTRGGADIRLDVTAEGATLTLGDETLDYTLEAFRAHEVIVRVVEALGVRRAAEAAAVAAAPELAARATTSRVAGRPRHPRVFGGGRGGTWVAWIFGRTVRLSARAIDVALDMSFEEVLESGLPPAFVAEAGEGHAESIVQAARELHPLECMCGTGAQTIEQHGGLRKLSHTRAPHAMTEHTAACGCCEVCGRWWSFEASGDSHYGYSYSVDSFDPVTDGAVGRGPLDP